MREGYPHAPLDVAAAPVVYSSLFNSIKTTRLTWGAQSDATGFNVYRSETSHLDYVKINASPVAGTSFADEETAANRAYYYVVTAVGPTGLEGNRSVEVVVAGDTLGAAAFPVPFILRLRGGR